MPYTTKAKCVEGQSKVVANDIPDNWLTEADEIINQRTGNTWSVHNATVDLDGNGERFIQLPKDYINSLSAVTMGDENNENIETLDLTELITDKNNAIVWRKTDTELSEVLDEDSPVWLKGNQNCHFTGSFGKATPEIIKAVATLIVQDKMLRIMGNKVDFDTIQYQTGKFIDKRLTRKSMDEIIEHYLTILVPDFPAIAWGATGNTIDF